MQTFLPLSDFAQSAKVLDWRRLGKQRVEARQIVRALLYGGGWQNHPAVQMWRGHVAALIHYSNVMIREWVARGYRNTMPLLAVQSIVTLPAWYGETVFHASHRSNLLRKDPEHYGQFGWKEGPDLPYYWPSVDG